MTMVKVIESAKHQLWQELFTSNSTNSWLWSNMKATKMKVIIRVIASRQEHGLYWCNEWWGWLWLNSSHPHTHAYKNDCETEDDCDPTRALYCSYQKNDYDYDNKWEWLWGWLWKWLWPDKSTVLGRLLRSTNTAPSVHHIGRLPCLRKICFFHDFNLINVNHM